MHSQYAETEGKNSIRRFYPLNDIIEYIIYDVINVYPYHVDRGEETTPHKHTAVQLQLNESFLHYTHYQVFVTLSLHLHENGPRTTCLSSYIGLDALHYQLYKGVFNITKYNWRNKYTCMHPSMRSRQRYTNQLLQQLLQLNTSYECICTHFELRLSKENRQAPALQSHIGCFHPLLPASTLKSCTFRAQQGNTQFFILEMADNRTRYKPQQNVQ